ncbi:MAG: VOC family protein [Tepidiformaceae bacterium]
MIPLKRIDHISMAAPSWKAQAEKLEFLLGFKFLHSWQAGANSDFSGSVSQVCGTEIEFEVIEPAGPRSFVQKFLDEQGPGLHHITAEVEDIEATAEALEEMGITPFGGITDDGMWRLTYIHPKESGGILWQLFVPYKFPEPADRNAGGGIVNLLRVDHVSLAVSDLPKQVAWQQKVFGMDETGRWTSEEEGYEGANLSIPGSLLKMEIIQPTRPDSFVGKFIASHRQGMHHICCEVESVEAAAAALRKAGIEPFGGVIKNGWKTHTFIHPRDSGGVLFQLFEEPK